jgi:hypothetical protein
MTTEDKDKKVPYDAFATAFDTTFNDSGTSGNVLGTAAIKSKPKTYKEKDKDVYVLEITCSILVNLYGSKEFESKKIMCTQECDAYIEAWMKNRLSKFKEITGKGLTLKREAESIGVNFISSNAFNGNGTVMFQRHCVYKK